MDAGHSLRARLVLSVQHLLCLHASTQQRQHAAAMAQWLASVAAARALADQHLNETHLHAAVVRKLCPRFRHLCGSERQVIKSLSAAGRQSLILAA